MKLNLFEINMDDMQSLKNFQKYISDLGHFYTPYKSIEDLLRQLDNQFDKILAS